MKNIKLQVDLILVESIEEFRQESGRRRIGMVYWRKVSRNVLCPEMIANHTKIKELEDLIELQKIYRYNKDY